MGTKHTKGFEDFLIDKHGEQYIGTDDCMPDDFNDWLEDRSIDDWIELGDKFAKKINAELLEALRAISKCNRGKGLPVNIVIKMMEALDKTGEIE